jgi:GNAT superfamily N-acetyltransferase
VTDIARGWQHGAMTEPTLKIELVPKTDAEIAAWVPVAMELYESARRDAGDDAEQAAVARRASEDRFFPDGRLADGQLVHTIVVDGVDAGWLWLGPWQDGPQWWVWDVRVHDRFRRRGVASAALRAGARVAREHGATSLGLNVFAVNEAAVALYTALGYRPTALHMSKEL